MKIEAETPTLLRLKQSLFLGYIAGILSIGFGLLLLYLGINPILSKDYSGEHWLFLVVGFILLIIGVVGFTKAGERYFIFDKDKGTLEIDNQTVGNKSRETYSLTELSKLLVTTSFETSSSRSSRSSRNNLHSNTRVVNYFTLQFSDGHMIELGSRTGGRGGVSIGVGSIMNSMIDTVGSSSLPVYIQKIVAFTNVEVEHVNTGAGRMLRNPFQN